MQTYSAGGLAGQVLSNGKAGSRGEKDSGLHFGLGV